MPPDPHTAYQPKALDRRELKYPLTPGMCDMGVTAGEEMRRFEMDLDARFDPFSPRVLRRVKLYVICAVICIPLLNYLLTPLGLRALWVQIPLAALYGAVMAWVRLRFLMAGLGLLATVLLTMTLAGSGANIITYMLYLAIGACVGVGEDLKRGDGD